MNTVCVISNDNFDNALKMFVDVKFELSNIRNYLLSAS